MRKYDTHRAMYITSLIQALTRNRWRYYFVVPNRFNVMNIAGIDSVNGSS